MKIQAFILLSLLLSCAGKQKREVTHPTVTLVERDSVGINCCDSNTEIIEVFSDSTKIGEKGQCKIEIIKHRVFDRVYVIVKFYTKGPSYWFVQDPYLYECTQLMDLTPQISDFNNDGLNDLTFISGSAARGANEVRRLFIYDQYNKRLLSIVNAQDYPNMQYNAELDCIDAFIVTGGCSTEFARIQGDSLKTFASVDVFDYRTVYEVDKNGNKRLIRKDSVDPENIYVRYKNYKPLKEYAE